MNIAKHEADIFSVDLTEFLLIDKQSFSELFCFLNVRMCVKDQQVLVCLEFIDRILCYSFGHVNTYPEKFFTLRELSTHKA